MFKDYYAILEIPQEATGKDIKKAFRTQAIKWHPDTNLGTDTTLQMQELNEAYLILKDAEARERYDKEYQRFKQYQQKKEETNNQERKNQFNERETNDSHNDYSVEDETLEKWISNAQKQAVNLAKQTIKDFKGVSNAAADGYMLGVIQLVFYIVITNIFFVLFKSCNT